MSRDFVHLHVHTEYSMLDGAARLKDLFAECGRMEMPALAMTDHGNLFGAYDFYQQATAAGIKPIIGMEAYQAPGSRFGRERVRWGTPADQGNDVSGGGAYLHLTLLAYNTEGLRNLFRLSSKAWLEGFYRAARVDKEVLAQHSAGLIVTTGCPSGEVQTRLRLGQMDAAVEAAAELQDIFGQENVFCELMDHGVEVERVVRSELLDVARRVNMPPLATNDSHYVTPDQDRAHEALLCVQSGATLHDPGRFRFEGTGYHLKSSGEMRALWDGQVSGACDNTLLIAERVESYQEVFAPRNLMPEFSVPEGHTEETWLREEVRRGLERRFPGGVPETHRKRADYELDVICQMGYPGYFLVVADLVRHAKEVGIRVGPGRGSAAGVLIAYALGITALDPLAHGLIFERFLNPERVSMPDVDLDFDERRRGEMIRYATERYGEERVAQIITYGTIKAKAAIKDAARVLGFPYALGDRVTKAMPPAVMGKDIPLGGIFDPQHERYGEAAAVRKLCGDNSQAREVMDTARGLEGLKRQWGVHAAGVILSREPLIEVLPVARRDGDGGESVVTQWDMGACESIGLLKMDFLGLRNLTVIDRALEHVQARTGVRVDLEGLALDDRKAYELLARGDTVGVFQLEGGQIRSLLRAMSPDGFEDISAVLALYRPGPMAANAHIEYADRKNGRKEVVPIHQELAEPLADILDDTYGLIVYQEQVIAIAQKVAGYSLGKADLLRRAMGKKKKEILDKEFEPFAAGMRANGYSEDAIETLWNILVPFSDYAFNKAHTAGYGLVSYWTAYLKANYPAEYMAALLTSVGDDKDKMAIYLAECRRMHIKVLPPDVNESAAEFTPVGGDIRFGLAAIRNVGAGVVDSIQRSRTENARFVDFYDFLSKIEPQACTKKVVESLIKAGAFDSMGHARKGLMAVHADTVESFMDVKRNEAKGQYDLFGSAFGEGVAGTSVVTTSPIPIAEWDKTDLLNFEKEMLGLYVSDHPLLGVERALAAIVDMPVSQLSDDSVADGAQVILAGILSGVQRRVTKQGRSWASATLEDLEGAVEVLFFPNTYEVVGQYIAEDAIVAVKGRVDRQDDVPRLMATDLSVPELTADPDAKSVVLALPAASVAQSLMEQLKEVLSSHPGTAEVQLRLLHESRTTVLRLGPVRVEPSPSLMADLKTLLGPRSVVG